MLWISAQQGVASRSAFSAVLEAEGENDVRGALFQFLQLLDIVRLSSLSRKWRALSLQRDIRSVCASLPAHLDSPDVNNVTLQRFLCKVRHRHNHLPQVRAYKHQHTGLR